MSGGEGRGLVDTGLEWPSRSRQHAAFQGCRRLRGGVIGVQERMSEVVVRLVRQGTTAPPSSPPTVLIHGEVAAVLPRLRQCTRGLATDRAPCACIFVHPASQSWRPGIPVSWWQARAEVAWGMPGRAEACRGVPSGALHSACRSGWLACRVGAQMYMYLM